MLTLKNEHERNEHRKYSGKNKVQFETTRPVQGNEYIDFIHTKRNTQ